MGELRNLPQALALNHAEPLVHRLEGAILTVMTKPRLRPCRKESRLQLPLRQPRSRSVEACRLLYFGPMIDTKDCIPLEIRIIEDGAEIGTRLIVESS